MNKKTTYGPIPLQMLLCRFLTFVSSFHVLPHFCQEMLHTLAFHTFCISPQGNFSSLIYVKIDSSGSSNKE